LLLTDKKYINLLDFQMQHFEIFLQTRIQDLTGYLELPIFLLLSRPRNLAKQDLMLHSRCRKKLFFGTLCARSNRNKVTASLYCSHTFLKEINFYVNSFPCLETRWKKRKPASKSAAVKTVGKIHIASGPWFV